MSFEGSDRELQPDFFSRFTQESLERRFTCRHIPGNQEKIPDSRKDTDSRLPAALLLDDVASTVSDTQIHTSVPQASMMHIPFGSNFTDSHAPIIQNVEHFMNQSIGRHLTHLFLVDDVIYYDASSLFSQQLYFKLSVSSFY
jgi:hypothetical protein